MGVVFWVLSLRTCDIKHSHCDITVLKSKCLSQKVPRRIKMQALCLSVVMDDYFQPIKLDGHIRSIENSKNRLEK